MSCKKSVPNAIVIPQPKVLKQGQNEHGLFHFVLALRNRKIIVTEPTLGVEERRRDFAFEVITREDLPEGHDKDILMLTYSALAATSTGDVPDSKGLQQMPEEDARLWIEKSELLAPRLWQWKKELQANLDQVVAKIEKKKKEKNPPR
jgi:hypothetical protein